jgi:hypothetical protein
VTALSVQTAGALLILVSYATQLYTQDANGQSKLNLVNNLVGSAMVAATSIGPRQWGTVLLESTWAAIAAVFLIRAVLAARHSADPVCRQTTISLVSKDKQTNTDHK